MRPGRSAVVVLAMALVVRALLWGIVGPLAAARAGTATFDDLVALAAAAVAFALLSWVGVVLAATTLAALPGAVGGSANRLVGRIAPGLAGRLARVALGLTLTAGPLSACTPAVGGGGGQQHEVVAAGVVGDSGLPGVGRIGEVITPSAAHTSGDGPGSGPADPAHLAGEPTGGAPTGGAPAGQAPAADPGSAAEPPGGEPTAKPPVPPPAAGLAEVATREQHPDGEVVVMRDDTLWAIAARHLRPDPTEADIAAEWPRWYAANRQVIGDDPDLILPGTILRPPSDG